MATLSTAAKNAALNAITALFTTSFFRRSGDLQAVTFSHTTTFSAASGGQASISAPIVYQQNAFTGTASRWDTGSGAPLILTVGGPGSGADIEISPSADVTTNMRIRLNSLTLTIP